MKAQESRGLWHDGMVAKRRDYWRLLEHIGYQWAVQIDAQDFWWWEMVRPRATLVVVDALTKWEAFYCLHSWSPRTFSESRRNPNICWPKGRKRERGGNGRFMMQMPGSRLAIHLPPTDWACPFWWIFRSDDWTVWEHMPLLVVHLSETHFTETLYNRPSVHFQLYKVDKAI